MNKHTPRRIVYMGTPDFAVASLKLLVEGGYNVVGALAKLVMKEFMNLSN